MKALKKSAIPWIHKKLYCVSFLIQTLVIQNYAVMSQI